MCISICAGKTMLEKFYLVISVRVRWGWGERDRSGSLSSGPGDTFLQTTQTLQGRQICREGMHHTISGALPPLLTYQPPSEGKGRSSRSCISGHRCTSSWQTVFLVFGCICGWHLYKVYSNNSGHLTGSQLHLWFTAASLVLSWLSGALWFWGESQAEAVSLSTHSSCTLFLSLSQAAFVSTNFYSKLAPTGSDVCRQRRKTSLAFSFRIFF